MLFCSLKIIKGKKAILYSLDLIQLLMVEWILFDLMASNWDRLIFWCGAGQRRAGWGRKAAAAADEEV